MDTASSWQRSSFCLCLGLFALVIQICSSAAPRIDASATATATASASATVTATEESVVQEPTMISHLLEKFGYPSETHHVTTEDGYILTLERVPISKRNPDERRFDNSTNRERREGGSGDKLPIILLHGMISNGMQFLIAGPKRGLGFLCSDAGLDVWLLNHRGSQFSPGHINPNIAPRQYWNFSFYETGIYDTLSAIDYVLEVTQKPKVHLLGYSMGASAGLIALSERPSYNDKVESLILMAPTTKMEHATTPLRYIAPYAESIRYLFKELDMQYLPIGNLRTMSKFNKHLCNSPGLGVSLCRQFLYAFQGLPFPFNTSVFHVPGFFDVYPDYCSSKTLVHYFQHLRSGEYCLFDYGSRKNQQIYNSTSPPMLDLSKVSTKTMIIYSPKDAFSNILDNLWLKSKLPQDPTIYEVQASHVFGHLSFMLDMKVDALVYKHIIRFLNPS